MIGAMRNLLAIKESPDLSPRLLATTYAQLVARRTLKRPPHRARLFGVDVAYVEFGALLDLFLEIYVRRHYPFRPMRANPLVIDCGANIGMATMFFKTVAPDARVLAFEPEPTAYRLLNENIDRNGLTDIICHRVALAAAFGEALLHIPGPAHGGATLHLPNPGWQTVAVQTAPLSSYVSERVDFVKLDVEGAESAVLDELHSSGAIELVEQLAIEHHPTTPESLSHLLEVLATAGFSCRIAVAGDRFWDAGQLLLIHAFRRGD
jgi:FkbM family methyltransferase